MRIAHDFEKAFGRPAVHAAQAPGRVNLIGEHTDYNGGFVFPAAIERRCEIAAAPAAGPALVLHSANFNERVSVPLGEPLAPQPQHRWANYVLASLAQLQQRGHEIPPLDLLVWGNVPLGGGLSSSAAIEVCTITLLQAILGTSHTRPEVALMAQAAEHSPFVGVQCGIMDQFISANAEKGHALMLDCHDLSFQLAPLDASQATIVIINSMKKRGLVDSEYNKRRSECEEGLAEIRRLSGQHFETIRHIPMDVFEDLAPRLDEGPRKRLRHNITENARVHDFRDALTRGDLPHAGFLLYEGHQSLARDYEVSCAELDTIVDIASRVDGVLGCRMTGAGFGGCAVALVRPAAVDEFQRIMAEEYHDATGKHPEFVVTAPAAGASALSI